MAENKIESQLDGFVTLLVELKTEKKGYEDQASYVEKEIRTLQGKILAYLEECKLPNFRGQRGLVSVVEKTNYKLPETEEDFERLRLWLEAQGLRNMLKPNSISFNSLAAREYEAAKEKGDPFFEIPGVGQPTVTKVISLREAK